MRGTRTKVGGALFLSALLSTISNHTEADGARVSS